MNFIRHYYMKTNSEENLNIMLNPDNISVGLIYNLFVNDSIDLDMYRILLEMVENNEEIIMEVSEYGENFYRFSIERARHSIDLKDIINQNIEYFQIKII